MRSLLAWNFGRRNESVASIGGEFGPIASLAAMAPVAQVAAHVAASARMYLVFFDWDNSNLIARAAPIIL
jgi:hypothetical protein